MNKTREEKKEELLSFVSRFYEEHFRTPSVREIEAGTSLSKSVAAICLAELRNAGTIDYDGRMIYTDRIIDEISGFNRTGVIGSIPCGNMALEDASFEKYVNLPISIFGTKKLFLLNAYGDSMVNAGIDDGDLVVVEQAETANNGDLVVAWVDGEGSTLKRYYNNEKKKKIILHPENEKYKDIIVDDVRIQGIVTHIIKKV